MMIRFQKAEKAIANISYKLRILQKNPEFIFIFQMLAMLLHKSLAGIYDRFRFQQIRL